VPPQTDVYQLAMVTPSVWSWGLLPRPAKEVISPCSLVAFWMSFLTCCTKFSRFLKAAWTLPGAPWMALSALCTFAESWLYALSIACLAAAKLPDAIAFEIDEPTELEADCSFLTSLHIALLGAEPLVLPAVGCR
jgi:hypothetical protein